MKKNIGLNIFINAFFILFSLCVILPFLIVISVSITNEAALEQYGFSLIPRQFDFTAYELVFGESGAFVHSMIFTAAVSVIAPIFSVAAMALIAFPLTRSDFRFKNVINHYLVYTMVIHAGIIPTYVINTKYYHLGNNPLIYFIGGLATAWGVILFRTFFNGIPSSLIESAEIDGANELQTIWYIIMPMAKSIFAIQYFNGVLGHWNNLQTSLLYMSEEKYFTIQHYMQNILVNVQVLKTAYTQVGLEMTVNLPINAMRYAMCLIAIIPVFILFPFVQKNFSKGLAVGSVKG